MKANEPLAISGKTRNLLLVSFVTLTLTAFIFLFSIQYFNRLNRAIFEQVESSVQTVSSTTSLSKMLVDLELDIRELITVILKEPYRLREEKETLLSQFDIIIKKAGEAETNAAHSKLLEQLRWYRSSLDILLDDYAVINAALYEIYFYINNYSEQYQLMEEAAGQLMIDQALEGKNTDALQQAYVLINHSHEHLLQSHILINASVANSTPAILGDFSSSRESGATQMDVLAKLESMESTLRTLTASDERIRYFATSILENMPLFLENIHDLQVFLYAMEEHYKDFQKERDVSLNLLEDVNDINQNELLSISDAVTQHGRKGNVIAWAIVSLVVVVSCAGLILTRRMGRHLELTAQAAVKAREKEKKLNLLLEQEVVERRQVAEDLKKAHDELEMRVKERTAALSTANRSLALEVEERRNAEYALASEKERLTITLRSIGEGVITTGVAGRVILINKVAEKLTGWSQNEAYGKPLTLIFDIVNESTGKKCDNPVDRMIHTGRIFEHASDTLLVGKDGTRRNIAASGSPIRDKSSQIIGVVLVFRDVTEKYKMEKEALKAEKLKSVGVLAGGIAHDFNNILAAILGSISLAKLHMATDEDQTRKLLEDAEKASLRARNLTQQLLTFSKGGEPVRKIASIDDIIRESTDFILTGGNIVCEYAISEDLWPVNIDSGQMSQVIQNIIINAAHAMPEGGQIRISCENYANNSDAIYKLAGRNFVRIAIQDQGTGIPEDKLEMIFDPYFTTKEEGSGLGLALTHSIITKHDGYIHAESGLQGTTFTIYLPAAPEYEVVEEPAKKISGTDNDYSAAQTNVLIMDDEPMVRDIARDMLIHLGFNVETARNGNEALDRYRKRMKTGNPIDVVIMDLTIPGGMGGKEAVQELIRIDPEVRAIVSSGYSNDPVMSEYRKHGFSGVVNKPFQLHELLDTISRVIKKGSQEQE